MISYIPTGAPVSSYGFQGAAPAGAAAAALPQGANGMMGGAQESFIPSWEIQYALYNPGVAQSAAASPAGGSAFDRVLDSLQGVTSRLETAAPFSWLTTLMESIIGGIAGRQQRQA